MGDGDALVTTRSQRHSGVAGHPTWALTGISTRRGQTVNMEDAPTDVSGVSREESCQRSRLPLETDATLSPSGA